MAVITMPGQDSWVVSRRGFELLMQRAQDQLSDPALIDKLTAAMALDGLHFGSIEGVEADKIVDALRLAISRLLTELDAQPQDNYVTSYMQLLNDLAARLPEPRG